MGINKIITMAESRQTQINSIPEEPKSISVYSTIDKSTDANPNAEVYQIIKDNIKPDKLMSITEYLLMPSDLRKHFIDICVGKTRIKWIFNIFTDAQKTEHIDIAIKDNIPLSPVMMPYINEEQKTKLFDDKLKKGKGLNRSQLELLSTEQLNQYVMVRIENMYCTDDDLSFDIFQKLDLKNKLEYITHVGISNLDRDFKDWYSNYKIGLKREEQIKSVLDV
jgi:hypothetical protein